MVQESKEDLQNDANMLKVYWSQPDVAPHGHIWDI